MLLSWILACTAPITAFIVFLQCIAMVKHRGRDETIEANGAFTMFILLYMAAVVGMLFVGGK